MEKVLLVGRSRTIKIGREPVVLVPWKLWRRVEDYLEDLEALGSKRYLRKIQKARKNVAAGKVVCPFG